MTGPAIDSIARLRDGDVDATDVAAGEADAVEGQAVGRQGLVNPTFSRENRRPTGRLFHFNPSHQ